MILLIFILIVSSAFAQEYNFTYDPLGIPLEMENSGTPVSPWIGGVSFAAPVSADIDADGDYDLFVGNGPGYILFYENTGTAEEAEWTFRTEAYDSIWAGIGYSASNFILAKPVFADLDDDQDLDLFIGANTGRIVYYSNQGNTSNPIWQYESNYWDSIYVVMDANPQFCDINGDNDLDLFIGDFQAHLHFYENIGTPSQPEFEHITNQFFSGMMDSRKTPTFIDIDNDGDYDCFVGGYYGRIHFYRNTGDSVNYAFEYVTDNYMNIDAGDYSAPYFCDIDDDGDYDLFVGEGGYPMETTPSLGIGDVNFYENTGDAFNANFVLRQQNMLSLDVGWMNNPAFVDIDNDGDWDLFCGELEGNVNFFRNMGDDNSPAFVFETEYFQESFYGWQSAATFADIDADCDQDMIVAGGVGFGETVVKLYRNDGPLTNPIYTLLNNNLIGYTIQLAKPYLCDIDNDNDSDLFIGDWQDGEGHLQYFENIGDSSRYNFLLQNDNLLGAFTGYLYPSFADLDNDGDMDLFLGEQNRIIYYENIGTPEVFNYVLVADTFFNLLNLPGEVYPAFCDIDNDGDVDLFYGELEGGLKFYRNVTTGVANPSFDLSPLTFDLLPCYPNPFNESLTIPFSLDQALPVEVVVYDALGQMVTRLETQDLKPEINQVVWDASGQASGVYFVRLMVDGRWSMVRKAALLK